MTGNATGLDLLRKTALEMVDLELKAGGLATKFHDGVRKHLTEKDAKRSMTDKEKMTVFADAMADLEEYAQTYVDKEWPAGTPLSTAVPQFRNYKSVYRNGIKQGLDPRDFDSFGKYRNAKLGKDDKKRDDSAPKGGKGKKGGDNAPESGNTDAPQQVPATEFMLDGIDPAVKAQLEKTLAVLHKLPVEQQQKVVKGFQGKTFQLLDAMKAANPRLKGVNKGRNAA